MVIAFARAYALRLAVLGAVTAYFLASTPQLISTSGAFGILEGFGLLGLVALGLGVTMISGELDLSAGSMVALASVTTIQLADLGFGLGGAIAATAVLGALFGGLQGLLIGRLGVSSLVFTLSTLIGLQGVAYWVSGSKPLVLDELTLSDPMLTRLWILSPSSMVAVLAFVVVGCWLGATRYGRELYATGGARNEARLAGVNVTRSLTISFAICGGCSALAGALAAMRSGSAAPDSFQTILFAAVVAVLIGGVGLFGGRGSVVNVAIGVLVASIVSSSMFASGSPTYVSDLAIGLILVFIVLAEYAALRRRIAGNRHALVHDGQAQAGARDDAMTLPTSKEKQGELT
ncbi:ABC transporter permease [Nocardioides jensenii]|uniref:ABC transporter permease n=1 Tax=Nocardioides jensenii TaxID=1843 RepID=UPI00082B740C|nr:ABC transporter permease [Nocardioides jensenii]